ncbi:DNA topoisomerase 2-alpha-like isoform X3 [Dermatophagoides pteronyssinus]|uniref:DNA topoisomerase 2-alpha-like isoform X3 n=1 Tax=Dermatophagoides pteronyssinus TaxID=6956 RepID=UPI003F66B2A5
MDDFLSNRPPLKALNSQNEKKRDIEEIYQKKSQLEHILLRPDTYIGSVEKETKQMWVYDSQRGMVLRDVCYVPGLYKIFDEILVNAADNKIRDPKMSCIRIDINSEDNEISVYNNGRGIPVVIHKDEKLYVPSLIFGHLLTSSNYNDSDKKVVGGRNGYGAKLCNIFSTMFKIETSSREYNNCFTQVWKDNMKVTEEPIIRPAKGEDFTRVTFKPDLKKFKMSHLDKDIVDLLSRRAYDVAGSSKGVKVFLNGECLPVRGFQSYINLFIKDKEDENNEPLKLAHEVVNDRWEIGIALSDKGFQQISFVNSIATTRGGKHVDHVADQIIAKLIENVKKKSGKSKVDLKPHQIRNHLWIFVNCLIENPTFDSQTKETMTLQSKNFGSKCTPSEKFFQSTMKIGIVDSILTWIRFKQQTEMDKKLSSKKINKLKGIPKLEDANDAGTKNSLDCTLILTEGDSAKSLVIAGFGVVGRDKFGVFPLRGKMLNVREATHKQIMENAEINSLVKILGLQYKKKYNTIEDLKTLRYGKLMIMTDQDQDGSHIKGLLINFIHFNWPSLIKLNFLEEFITPIVKVTKGSFKRAFYSLPEFEEWKQETPNYRTYKIKYYKGLGTSTSEEAKEYFSDMKRHRIKFRYDDDGDDKAVELAFSKKMVEARKDWLTSGMEERRRRRENGEKEIYLYEHNTHEVTYKDFINKELILFSNMDNERSIPSLVDGFKPGQRKVIYTCFKRNDKREVKVAQLAGSVGELSAYHHGEMSLMSTIINLAQNFVGSNNINLLEPHGQFGTRLQGGKDAASPRYIFTMLSPLARKLFPPLDDPLLAHLYDDNLRIEPEYYVPIIPMVLVNGAEGIGTGWSTKVPNYDPRAIVDNIKRMIRNEEPVEMNPWYKGFRGTVVKVDPMKYVINGEVAILDERTIEITELPVRTWTQVYKESILEPMLHGTEKSPALINDYKEYHTDTTIKFLVQMNESSLEKVMREGIHKEFRLQTSMSISSMVLFDKNGIIRRYESSLDILREFFPVRLDFYVRRKKYYEGMLEAEALKLENQARFILEKNDKKIIMENIKKKEFLKVLLERKYDSDPVKAWRKKYNIDQNDTESANNDNDEEVDEQETEEEKKYDYDYLIDMTMRTMLRENVQELLKKRDAKKSELEDLKRSTPQMLWERDLDSFVEELDRVEKMERETAMKGIKPKKSAKITAKGLKLTNIADIYKPSEQADRIEPKIDFEKYQPKKEKKERVKKSTNSNKDKKKDNQSDDGKSPENQKTITAMLGAVAAAVAKTDKKSNAQSDEDDDDDVVEIKPKQPANKLKLKQTTINFGKAKDTKLKTFETKQSSSTNNDKRKSDEFDDEVIEKPKKTTANKKHKFIISSDEDEDSLQELPTPSPKPSLRARRVTNYKQILDNDDDSEDDYDDGDDDDTVLSDDLIDIDD